MPLTVFTAITASRYSSYQSSSSALTRLSALRAASLTHGAIGVNQCANQCWQMRLGAVFIDKQVFRAPQMPVRRILALSKTSRAISSDAFSSCMGMAHAIKMRENRRARLTCTPDQAFTAARHVRRLHRQPGQHHADGGAVRRVDRYAIFIEIGTFQRACKTAMNETCRY